MINSAILMFGVGIVGVLLAYMFFKFENQNHEILRLLLLGCMISIFVLIGKVGLDSGNSCDLVLNNTYEVNTTIYFNYSTVCYDNTEANTGVTFYKLTLWIVRLISAYITVYLIWYVFKWLRNIINNRQMRNNDE